MADSIATILAPRSRAPINQAGITLWEACTDNDVSNKLECVIEANNGTNPFKTFQDKSTSTNFKTVEIDFTIGKSTIVGDSEYNPKDTVLKKWRERQAKAKHERARRAVINSLEEKFRGTKRQANLDAFEGGNKDYIHRSIPTIVITEDVEDTSNMNVNRSAAAEGNFDSKADGFKVNNGTAAFEVVCHARKLQMGPGGELAQWRLAPRGSRAAGAEGGLRGTVREAMPVSWSNAQVLMRLPLPLHALPHTLVTRATL
ncbi:unnamed protein product, partial [Iphiclides podalirius]